MNLEDFISFDALSVGTIIGIFSLWWRMNHVRKMDIEKREARISERSAYEADIKFRLTALEENKSSVTVNLDLIMSKLEKITILLTQLDERQKILLNGQKKEKDAGS